MTFSFTTLLATISAILSAVLGAMTSILGCAPATATSAATCTAGFLSPTVAGWAAVVFGILSIGAALISPGGPLANLFGAKAVILPENDPRSGVGTTTPGEVARP